MLRLIPCAALLPVMLCGTLLPLLGQEKSNSEKSKVDPRTVSVAFTDGSHLKVLLAEETIDLQTPHGKLTFPITDIVRIECAYRVPDEVALSIDKLITDLGSTDFKVRENAMASLLEKKEKCYAALVRASRQQTDLEMRQRIEHLIERLRQDVPEERLNVRTQDFVYTADSKIAGKLLVTNFKISSAQFGQLQLKLSDIRDLRSHGAAADEPEDDLKNVLADPGNMLGHNQDIGKSFAFRVTGQASYCYGTDVYTTDSPLASVAVHMGILKPGETGVVIASVVASPPMFVSSSRHGITSSGWSQYPAGYTLRKARTAPK
jgi:ElaB/YqjD/DUF883 family membrane-anchored ribosome-binding protein